MAQVIAEHARRAALEGRELGDTLGTEFGKPAGKRAEGIGAVRAAILGNDTTACRDPRERVGGYKRIAPEWSAGASAVKEEQMRQHGEALARFPGGEAGDLRDLRCGALQFSWGTSHHHTAQVQFPMVRPLACIKRINRKPIGNKWQVAGS